MIKSVELKNHNFIPVKRKVRLALSKNEPVGEVSVVGGIFFFGGGWGGGGGGRVGSKGMFLSIGECLVNPRGWLYKLSRYT